MGREAPNAAGKAAAGPAGGTRKTPPKAGAEKDGNGRKMRKETTGEAAGEETGKSTRRAEKQAGCRACLSREAGMAVASIRCWR